MISGSSGKARDWNRVIVVTKLRCASDIRDPYQGWLGNEPEAIQSRFGRFIYFFIFSHDISGSTLKTHADVSSLLSLHVTVVSLWNIFQSEDVFAFPLTLRLLAAAVMLIIQLESLRLCHWVGVQIGNLGHWICGTGRAVPIHQKWHAPLCKCSNRQAEQEKRREAVGNRRLKKPATEK